MFCSECGTQLPSDAKACPACGKKLAANNEINMRDIANFAGGKAKDALGAVKSKSVEYGNELKQKSQEMQESLERQREQKINDANDAVNNMFVDSAEKEIATLGSGYLKNFLLSGSLEKGFCTVTDKRVYFKGKCYYKIGGAYKSSNEERIVSIRDITGTGFVEIKHFWLWILFAYAFLATIFLFGVDFFLMRDYEGVNFVRYVAIFCLIISMLIVAAYNYFKPRYFEIAYAGGIIAFKASSYGMPETQAFQKALHKAKDAALHGEG